MKESIPKTVRCKFLTGWRGHDAGAVADLTTERAAELIGEGVCEPAERGKQTAPADEGQGDAPAGPPKKGGRQPKAPQETK